MDIHHLQPFASVVKSIAIHHCYDFTFGLCGTQIVVSITGSMFLVESPAITHE